MSESDASPSSSPLPQPTAAPLVDRAGHLRSQPDKLAALLNDPNSLIVPLWRNRNLIAPSDPPALALLEVSTCGDLIKQAPEVVFLGVHGEHACFGLTVDPGKESLTHSALVGQGEFRDLRVVGSTLPIRQAELLAYARGILYWHRHHRFCADCGGKTTADQGGHIRLCSQCQKQHFPRTDPAIMALVVNDDRCLLARQPGFPKGMFSVLAGFVEPGESLEDAVIREVREEVGLTVSDVRYLRSQPWPFPSSLMLGFIMQSKATQFQLDEQELEEARWFTRADLRDPENISLPPPYSLARQLIALFLDDAD